METGSTNTILREIKYCRTLEKSNGSVMTSYGRDMVIVGSGQSHNYTPCRYYMIIMYAFMHQDCTRTFVEF